MADEYLGAIIDSKTLFKVLESILADDTVNLSEGAKNVLRSVLSGTWLILTPEQRENAAATRKAVAVHSELFARHPLKNAYTTRPIDVEIGDWYAWMHVAVVGEGKDWAVYRGLPHWPVEKTAEAGDKIPRDVAEAIFPLIKIAGFTYRS